MEKVSPALKWLFARTLNNVWFGIAMMALVAAYVAIGSGWPGAREFFEQDELAFFNAWPFKVLMSLLVANLVTVTFLRIPFTVPRYGVWMIHAGIITLIYGMAYYYSFKEEGLTLIGKGEAVTTYYDKWERALYVRVAGQNTGDELQLKGLPRFKAHPPGHLNEAALTGLQPAVIFAENGQERAASLREVLNLPAPLNLDIVGYWPYARLISEYVHGDPGNTGLAIEIRDPAGKTFRKTWVVAAEPGAATEELGGIELEHREAKDEAAAKEILDAAGDVHEVEVMVGGKSGKFQADLGSKISFEGYELTVEQFDPAWRTMAGEVVKLLTVMVQPPGGREKFRRQMIPGREKITDWKLGVEGAGPMGKRQDAPLDAGLVTRYAYADALGLMPGGEGGEKRTFVTAGRKTWMVATSYSKPAAVREMLEGKIEMDLPGGENGAGGVLHVERAEGLVKREWVEEVPSEKRSRQDGESGLFQVVAVRASCGEWRETVYVPFAQWAMQVPWTGGKLHLPFTKQAVQLQLGMRVRPIAPDFKSGRPATVRLEDFKLRTYAGGSDQSPMQRDFLASLTITEGNGRERQGVAHMNSPVYFGATPMFGVGDAYWTLFQASWDPAGQRWTILGVGNRPGIWIMVTGVGVTVVGLMYAFYLKPVIIRRRKAAAIAAAGGRGVNGEARGRARREAVGSMEERG